METFLIVLDYADKDGGTDIGGWGTKFYKVQAEDIDDAMEKAACIIVIFMKQNSAGTIFDKDYSLNKIYSKDRFYEFGTNFFFSGRLRQEKAPESLEESLKRIDKFRRICSKKGAMGVAALEKRLGGKPVDFEVQLLDDIFRAGD